MWISEVADLDPRKEQHPLDCVGKHEKTHQGENPEYGDIEITLEQNHHRHLVEPGNFHHIFKILFAFDKGLRADGLAVTESGRTQAIILVAGHSTPQARRSCVQVNGSLQPLVTPHLPRPLGLPSASRALPAR
jgi:hypothetical protein